MYTSLNFSLSLRRARHGAQRYIAAERKRMTTMRHSVGLIVRIGQSSVAAATNRSDADAPSTHSSSKSPWRHWRVPTVPVSSSPLACDKVPPPTATTSPRALPTMSPRVLVMSIMLVVSVDVHWGVSAAPGAVAHGVAARPAAKAYGRGDERERVEGGGEGVDVAGRCCCRGVAVFGGRVFFDERAVCEGACYARRVLCAVC